MSKKPAANVLVKPCAITGDSHCPDGSPNAEDDAEDDVLKALYRSLQAPTLAA